MRSLLYSMYIYPTTQKSMKLLSTCEMYFRDYHKAISKSTVLYANLGPSNSIKVNKLPSLQFLGQPLQPCLEARVGGETL